LSNEVEHIELRSEEVQEILGHIPARIIRYGITVILSVVVVLFVGSFLFSYPDILTAPVEVVSQNAPAAIVAKTSGNLTSIFVADSQWVKEHQVMAVLKNPALFEHVQWLQTELRIQKQNGIIDTQWFNHLPDTLQLGDLQVGYASLLRAGQEYLRFGQLNVLEKKIAALQQKQVELEKYIRISSRQVLLKQQDNQLSKSQFLRDSQLFRKEVISLADYEKARNELLQQSMNLESLRSSEVNGRMQMQDLVQQIIDYQLENIKQEQQFRNQWMESIQNMEGLIDGWFDGYVLVAPMEGIVAFNKIWSQNQFVQAGNEVFTVIPLHRAQIIGRITLPAKGSGKVAIGQRVNLKFESFPYQEFGMVTAIVSAVSLVPAEQNYMVEINLPDTLITNYGFLLPFTQKMLGTAEIITEDMPLIMRLFNPLKAIFKKHWNSEPAFRKSEK